MPEATNEYFLIFTCAETDLEEAFMVPLIERTKANTSGGTDIYLLDNPIPFTVKESPHQPPKRHRQIFQRHHR